MDKCEPLLAGALVAALAQLIPRLRKPSAFVPDAVPLVHGRGLHSSTFQLNLSRSWHIIHPKQPLTPHDNPTPYPLPPNPLPPTS